MAHRPGERGRHADAYYVKALWDAEAKVWVSETDIPGLIIEADTLAEFENLFQALAPEMLAENAGVHDRSIRHTSDL
ncbi:DUF1902 domain-containing protein [Caulobacter sp. S45]|uniref:DUF1902 domain-containing protein n=1 Tax=Caulobacter sp. S45 TaxID=1641861 RepID=UPI0015772554|nr:DUF1902 domain-containing protein [Caulobacter sp. S45]